MTQLEQTDEWFRVIERYLLEKTFTARDACWRIEETIALLPPECDPVPYRYVRQNLLDEEAYYHGLLNESIQACRKISDVLTRHQEEYRQETANDISRGPERDIERKEAWTEFYETQDDINNRSEFYMDNQA